MDPEDLLNRASFSHALGWSAGCLVHPVRAACAVPVHATMGRTLSRLADLANLSDFARRRAHIGTFGIPPVNRK